MLLRGVREASGFDNYLSTRYMDCCLLTTTKTSVLFPPVQSTGARRQQQLRTLSSWQLCFVLRGDGFLRHKQPSQSLVLPEASSTGRPDLCPHCNTLQHTATHSAAGHHIRAISPRKGQNLFDAGLKPFSSCFVAAMRHIRGTMEGVCDAGCS